MVRRNSGWTSRRGRGDGLPLDVAGMHAQMHAGSRERDLGWIGRSLTKTSESELDRAARQVVAAVAGTYYTYDHTAGVCYLESAVLEAALGYRQWYKKALINPNPRKVSSAEQIVDDAPKPQGGNLARAFMSVAVQVGVVSLREQDRRLQLMVVAQPTYDPGYDQDGYRRAEAPEFCWYLAESWLRAGYDLVFSDRLAEAAPQFLPSVARLGQLVHVPQSLRV